MSWLTPLGFLGLIGLIVLLIIYLIKPNYQNKHISSTFVWKLSLKYRKKKLPISKLRDILLIVCQMLIITACAFILAQPYIDGDSINASKEKVIIIDASGSMRAQVDKETRFERAVEDAKKYAGEALRAGGKVSVILASDEATFVVRRQDVEQFDQIMTDMSMLTDKTDFRCSWEAGDIDGAMTLSEGILEENPEAEVVLYTGKEYIDDGKVTVKDVTDPTEWNVAILDVRVTKGNIFDRYEVDVGSYALGQNVRVYMDIHGGTVNDVGETGVQNGSVVTVYYDVMLDKNSSQTITFGENELDSYTGLQIKDYEYVYCYVLESDSMDEDNSFYNYGGVAQPLKIQYYSTRMNNFVSGMILSLRQQLKNDWQISYEEIRDNEKDIASGKGKKPALEGYDIYIFEHHMPEMIPTDGLVILINPKQLPSDVEVVLGSEMRYRSDKPLNSEGIQSPLLNGINAENITIRTYRQFNAYDGAYSPVLCVDDNPVVLAKNSPDQKVMILNFSLHYSNLALTPEFPMLMKNAIDYYLPKTFEKDVYNIYDEVELNSRSQSLTLSGPESVDVYESFPAKKTVDVPGLYTVTQTPNSGIQIVENFYVTIPDEQSNIDAIEDRLVNPYFPPVEEKMDLDLVFYFALALVLLGFAEWWLKSREQN